MPVVYSLEELFERMRRDFRGHERAVRGAVRRSAIAGADIVRRNVPVAFSELRDSVHSKNTRAGADIIADAPHAASVEFGSRPHMPPVEPIERWVKLRARQGLLNARKLKRLPGTSTRQAARDIADWVSSMEGPDGSVDADAPRKIAWAIAMSIKKNGTKPQHFMAKSLPAVEALLDAEISSVMSRRMK